MGCGLGSIIMKTVNFIQTTDTDEKIVMVLGIKSGKPVVIKGKKFAKAMNIPGTVFQAKNGIPFYPSDGWRYLKAAQYQFSGSRLRATDIIEVG
jgi:hypothetical protein